MGGGKGQRGSGGGTIDARMTGREAQENEGKRKKQRFRSGAGAKTNGKGSFPPISLSFHSNHDNICLWLHIRSRAHLATHTEHT